MSELRQISTPRSTSVASKPSRHLVTIPDVHGPAMSIFRIGLACCALLTLLCTPGSKLIPTKYVGIAPNVIYDGINKASLFYIFADTPELGRVVGILLCALSLTGVTSIGVLWVFFSLHNTGITPDGGDQIGLIASLFCVVFGLSSWLVKTYPARRAGYLIGYYALFGFKLQIAFLYINASIAKIRVDNWVNGTEVYYDVISPFFGLTGLRKELLLSVLDHPLILVLLTWGTMAVELFIGIAVFASDRWKAIALVAVLLLHGGIALFLGIVSFSLTMITSAIFCLIPTPLIGKETSEIHEWYKNSLPRLRL